MDFAPYAFWRDDLSAAEVLYNAVLLSIPVLIPSPMSGDSHLWSFLVSLTMALTVVLLYQLAAVRPCLVSCAIAAELSIYYIANMVVKYSSKRNMFLCESVWKDIEDCSRSVIIIMYLIISTLSILLERMVIGALIGLPLAVILFIITYYKAYSGRTLLMKRTDEKNVREILALDASPTQEYDNPYEIPRMNALYMKVLAFMDEKQAFLDPDMDIRSLATTMFSNRTYLSKTINAMSGKTYPQFVNGYRVRYALKLIERNPHLRVNEVAFMSGFNSSVTFTMAFKSAMGTTPSAYISKYLEGKITPDPSRKKEPEQ